MNNLRGEIMDDFADLATYLSCGTVAGTYATADDARSAGLMRSLRSVIPPTGFDVRKDDKAEIVRIIGEMESIEHCRSGVVGHILRRMRQRIMRDTEEQIAGRVTA